MENFNFKRNNFKATCGRRGKCLGTADIEDQGWRSHCPGQKKCPRLFNAPFKLFLNCIQWMSKFRTGLVFRHVRLRSVSRRSNVIFWTNFWTAFRVFECSKPNPITIMFGLNDQKNDWNQNFGPFGFRHGFNFGGLEFGHPLFLRS